MAAIIIPAKIKGKKEKCFLLGQSDPEMINSTRVPSRLESLKKLG
jgi:hypothetical protein